MTKILILSLAVVVKSIEMLQKVSKTEITLLNCCPNRVFRTKCDDK